MSNVRSTTSGGVERESDDVGEEAALAHSVASFPRCDLELGDAMRGLQVEVSFGIIARAEGWAFDQGLTQLEDQGQHLGDDCCVDQRVDHADAFSND